MTSVADIITRAYREPNVVTIGATPTTNELAEGLVLLNALILSTVGNEVSDGLNDLRVGGEFDQSVNYSTFIPENLRLVLNLDADKTMKLDPAPYEGQRLAMVDVAGNLAINSLTLDPNGRLIEGASTLLLNTAGMTCQWMYRADTADWTKISELADDDDMPFPLEFDNYFAIVLAMRIVPRHSASLSPETLAELKRMRSQIRARYHTPKQFGSDISPRGLRTYNQWGVYSDPGVFSRGKNFPW